MKNKTLSAVSVLGLALILSLFFSLMPTGGTCAAPPRADVAEGVAPCALASGSIPISQVAKLFASDGWTLDLFGGAVGISGDTVVVGAYRDIVGTNRDQGSAYVFERDQGGPDQWEEVTKIVASDGTDDDYFGISVGIAGDIIVVGAYSDDIGDHTSQGSAYLFKRNLGGVDPWVQAKKLTADDGGYWDYFGRSVAIAGDTVVVGASGDGGRGSAYVFQRDQDGPGLWGQVKKLTADDAATGDAFGYAVAIAGDTIIVGDYLHDVGSNDDQGAAYIFERNQDGIDQWGQVTRLTAADGAALGYFGRAVAIAGDTVVVGAYGDNLEQGAAYVFGRNHGGVGQWGQVTKLTASDGADGDRFGRAAAIAGDTVVVGADGDDVGSNASQGSAYVFGRNQGGTDQWGQVEKLTADDGADGDAFGYAAAIAGNTIVIGARYDDFGSTEAQGSAYVFQSEAKIYLPLVVRQSP